MISRWCLNCCLFYLSVLEEYLYTYITQRSIMQYSPSFPDVLNMKLRKHYKKTFFILCYSWRSKTTPVSPCATFKKTGFYFWKILRREYFEKMYTYKHKKYRAKHHIWIFWHKLKFNLYLSQLKYKVVWLTLLSGISVDKRFPKIKTNWCVSCLLCLL